MPLLPLALACASLLAQDPKPAPPMTWTGVLNEEEFKKLHDLKAEAAPPARGVMVEVDGQKHYLSLPDNAKPPLPAVLLIHEWWGLNGHIKHWADRLAADGYAALAVDLYEGKVAGTRDEAMAAMQAVDETKALATLRAAHGFLKSDARVQASKRASLGWCFGGAWSLRLAIAAPDLDAAVLYYGRLVTEPNQLAAIKAPLLGVFGTRDRGIPPAAVDTFEAALQTAGRTAKILRYDADHAFANPSGQRYDEKSASAAWTEVRTFLAEHLKPKANTPDLSQMRSYVFGMLKPGPNRKDKLEPARAQELQAQHLAHIGAMAQRGELVLAGPMMERPGDDPIIGIFVFTVDKAKARELADQDPLVKAGRLRCELIEWFGPKWLVERAPK